MTQDRATEAFAELAAAAREGRAPDPAIVKWLAERAVPALATEGDARARSLALGAALGIKASKPPSRPEMTAGQARPVYRAVGWLIQREEALRAAGTPKRAAGAQAKRETAARFHRSVRTIQGWLKTWRPICQVMLADARQRNAELVRDALETREVIAAVRAKHRRTRRT